MGAEAGAASLRAWQNGDEVVGESRSAQPSPRTINSRAFAKLAPIAAASLERERRANAEEARMNRKIIPRLAGRCYHLPGYSLCEDWAQYMMNNHPLFGICCHHKLHPLGIKQRVICLVGSIAFGLVATNAVFLYYSLHSELSMDDTVFQIDIMSNSTYLQPRSLEVTAGMLSLWTFGGAFRSIFDLTIWYGFSIADCCVNLYDFTFIQIAHEFVLIHPSFTGT